MVLWLARLALAAPVNCESSAEKAEIDRLLAEAEAAVAALDAAALASAMEQVRSQVLCVEHEIGRPDVARIFRLSGISRYVSGDLVLSVADFEIAKAMQPDAQIDPNFGRPLRLTWDAVPPSTGETRDLPDPSEGWVDIDGMRSEKAPIDRSYFMQWVGADGVVRGNWLLAETDALPYPMGNTVTEKTRRGGGGKVLLITGIASVALAAGGIAGAAVMEGQFDDSDEPSSAQGSLITTNRVLGYGGIGLGVAGLGLVGASFAVGF